MCVPSVQKYIISFSLNSTKLTTLPKNSFFLFFFCERSVHGGTNTLRPEQVWHLDMATHSISFLSTVIFSNTSHQYKVCCIFFKSFVFLENDFHFELGVFNQKGISPFGNKNWKVFLFNKKVSKVTNEDYPTSMIGE